MTLTQPLMNGNRYAKLSENSTKLCYSPDKTAFQLLSMTLTYQWPWPISYQSGYFHPQAALLHNFWTLTMALTFELQIWFLRTTYCLTEANIFVRYSESKSLGLWPGPAKFWQWEANTLMRTHTPLWQLCWGGSTKM